MRIVVTLALGAVGLAALGVVGLVVHGQGAFSFPDTPYPDGLVASADAEAIARGEYLVWGPAHCTACHASYARERPEDNRPGTALAGGLPFDLGPMGTIYGLNLTSHPTEGLGRFSDAELARTLRTGVRPNGQLSVFMALSASRLSDDDVVAVLSYLRALPAAPAAHGEGALSLLGSAVFGLVGFGPRGDAAPVGAPPSDTPDLARGAYLADSVALCTTTCHRAYDPSTFEPVGPLAAGGNCEPSHGPDSDMEYCPPNLTSHPTGYVGQVDEEAFVARFRTGRVHTSSIMPWENYGRMSDADLRSIYRHLRALPPVDHELGPSYRRIGSHPAP